MKGHAENALLFAQYLEAHPLIEKVYYPGLPSHPQYEVAFKQMTGFSGMLSVLVKGDGENAKKVVNKVHLFAQATSLGGVESLIEHRASVEGPDTKTPQNLIRISIGLEDVNDLIADFEQALR